MEIIISFGKKTAVEGGIVLQLGKGLWVQRAF